MAKRKKGSTRGKKRWHILVGGLVLILTVINIISSQTISSFYFPLIRNDKNAVVLSLQKLVGQPEFEYVLAQQEERLNTNLDNKVFVKGIDSTTQISQLEYGLELNPKSPQVLYRLYELYTEEREPKKAAEYLRRAKEVDPSINTKF